MREAVINRCANFFLSSRYSIEYLSTLRKVKFIERKVLRRVFKVSSNPFCVQQISIRFIALNPKNHYSEFMRKHSNEWKDEKKNVFFFYFYKSYKYLDNVLKNDPSKIFRWENLCDSVIVVWYSFSVLIRIETKKKNGGERNRDWLFCHAKFELDRISNIEKQQEHGIIWL